MNNFSSNALIVIIQDDITDFVFAAGTIIMNVDKICFSFDIDIRSNITIFELYNLTRTKIVPKNQSVLMEYKKKYA